MFYNNKVVGDNKYYITAECTVSRPKLAK